MGHDGLAKRIHQMKDTTLTIRLSTQDKKLLRKIAQKNNRSIASYLMEGYELIDVLEDVINQACRNGEKNELDSLALSAYASGMRKLAELGRLTITHQYGRRVIGYWNNEEPPNEIIHNIVKEINQINPKAVPKCHCGSEMVESVHNPSLWYCKELKNHAGKKLYKVISKREL